MTRAEAPHPTVCVFDVIETLLDLRGLDAYFARVFGDAGAREQWFQRVLKTALVTTVTGPYHDFSEIGQAALGMTAELRGVALSDGDRQELKGALRSLPAHPDARPGLSALRNAGFRLATLSNNPAESSRAQLEAADLIDFFEVVLSADDAGRLKPAPEPYRYAAGQLGVALQDMWLVAAHGWDITGGRQVGCRTAFVARPGHLPSPLGGTPDLTGADLPDVARQLLARSGGSA